MTNIFRLLSIALTFNALTHVAHSASNQCYYSREHFLGMGSTYTLDSTVIIKRKNQELVSRIAFTYKINEDTIYSSYKVTRPDDSILVDLAGSFAFKNRVWLFTDTSDHDTNLIVNTTATYFNDKYKIDSIVEMRISSTAELDEKEIHYNTDSAQVQYKIYPNRPPIIDSTVFNQAGLVKYSIEGDSIHAIDTCISLDTICVCHGDRQDRRLEYQVINDQIQYELEFFVGYESEIRHFWSNKQSSIHGLNSKRRAVTQFDRTKRFTLDGRQVYISNVPRIPKSLTWPRKAQ